MNGYYIASCVFTSKFPERSAAIAAYAREQLGLQVVRCCVPKYKLQLFAEKMPEGALRAWWTTLPDSAAFAAGDRVYSLCHNCSNIIEEMHPAVQVCSLWEAIDADPSFPLPDYTGMKATLQDCWRAKDRKGEQDAVRSLLDKMHIVWREAPQNRADCDFCGNSLYRPQPPRNPKLAPKHYAEGAKGLFLPHSEEEQQRIMQDYCSRYETKTVICYCHYCLEGLESGGKDGRHIAELLFG